MGAEMTNKLEAEENGASGSYLWGNEIKKMEAEAREVGETVTSSLHHMRFQYVTMDFWSVLFLVLSLSCIVLFAVCLYQSILFCSNCIMRA